MIWIETLWGEANAILKETKPFFPFPGAISPAGLPPAVVLKASFRLYLRTGKLCHVSHSQSRYLLWMNSAQSQLVIWGKTKDCLELLWEEPHDDGLKKVNALAVEKQSGLLSAVSVWKSSDNRTSSLQSPTLYISLLEGSS